MCGKKIVIILLLFIFIFQAVSQTTVIKGKITAGGEGIAYANVGLLGTKIGTSSDTKGVFFFTNIKPDNYKLHVSCIGYESFENSFVVSNEDTILMNIVLKPKSNALNEIVVTGSSKATLIRENPISIISISTKAIEQTSESNIIDALVKNVPGLNSVKTGPNISKPFIRGLGYNRVLTLYDGIRQEGQQWGDEHGIEVDQYNIEKAEVIKGPSSLMYGSDALAGVVSLFPFIPNKYDKKLHGKITNEYQSNNNLIGNGFRVGYSNKSLLLSIRGSYRIANNYRNVISKRVYNTNFDEKNLSALIGYKSDKGYSHFNITLYDNLQGIPDGSRDSITREFTKQIYEGNSDDLKNRPIVSDKELNTYKLSPLHQHIQHYRIYTRNYYQIGKSDINFQLAFQQNIRREFNHPTIPKQAGMFVRLNTYNYTIRYNAPKFANVEFSIGANGMVQNNKSKNATNFPIPDYDLFDGGTYLYGKWKQDKWSVSGGIRYDVRKVHFNDFYVSLNPLTNFEEHVNLPDTINAILQFPAYKTNFSGLSASLGMTLQATKNISIKVNIGRGYRAPNIPEIASNGLDPGAHIIYLGNRRFDPEFSLQEDFGINMRFKDVSAELSLFNNNIENYISLTQLVDNNGKSIVDAQGNRTFQYQQSAAQLYGMEAWVFIHPESIEGFNIHNSFSIVYGYNLNPRFKGEGLNGEYLPLIPPFKLMSNISQKVKLKSKILKLFTPKFEIEYNAAQNKFLGLNNTETFTPSYLLFNIGTAF